MPLSYWADYLTMVAEQTNHTTDHVWHRMPYARGLQYRTLWLEDHGYQVAPAGPRIAPLRRKIG